MNVGELVGRAVARHAKRVAFEGPGGVRTYAEIGDRIGRLATGLISRGLAPGDRVLDLQPNQVTCAETDLALAAAGFVRVALNHRLHPRDWAYIADDCAARALVYDARFADRTEELRSGLDHVVVIGDGPGVAYERLIADHPAAPLTGHTDPDHLVSLNYSSGTTGRPKGARRTHRNRLASLRNMLTDVLPAKPGPRDTWVHAGPITHTSGLFVLPYFAFGARQLILPKYDAAELIDVIENRGGTATALVPTMIARLLALPDCTPERLRMLRMLGYAGAPMPPEQIRQAYERITPKLVQYYGLVEAIPPVTVLDADEHGRAIGNGDNELLTSAGRACLGVDLRLVDEADGVGEVVTRGEHVMSGYWGGTGGATKTVHEGWLHTGDLGRIDGSGYLYLVDRKDDMIISGGYNIYPREIEDVIAAIPGVHEVAVVGVTDHEWGQRIVALYTTRAGAAVAAEAILDRCRAELAPYKKPKEVRQVDSLPLNATGKIAKKALRAQLEAP